MTLLKGAVAIFRRDIKKFISTPYVIVFTLFMPIMYLVIFGNAIGGTITGIHIGVVQAEPYTIETPLFTRSVEALRNFRSAADKPTVFDVTVYSDEDSAKRALANGEISGAVVFPSTLPGDTTVRVFEDSSDYAIPALMEGGITAAIASTGMKNPVDISRVYGKIEYFQFFGVGVIVMAIFMTTMMGGAFALIRDREQGIIEGYLVTPVKRSSIILGIIGSGSVKAFLSGLIIVIVDVVIAGIIIRTLDQFLLVLLVLAISSIGVTALVVSVASRFNTQQEYASTVAFFNLILFMTSGAFYPPQGMPGWLRWITVINPEWYTVHALRSILLRGQGLTVIGYDLAALCVFSAAAIILGILTYKRTIE
ncbi:MAG TPA: ABC transporter permease [Methanomicrobiales archaeon]|jgi:ABC-2 type transport system permease protein|nr:ABC transporter permease [Methanomicrobiales archaeon]